MVQKKRIGDKRMKIKFNIMISIFFILIAAALVIADNGVYDNTNYNSYSIYGVNYINATTLDTGQGALELYSILGDFATTAPLTGGASNVLYGTDGTKFTIAIPKGTINADGYSAAVDIIQFNRTTYALAGNVTTITRNTQINTTRNIEGLFFMNTTELATTYVNEDGDILTGTFSGDYFLDGTGDFNTTGRVCDSTGCIIAGGSTFTRTTTATNYTILSTDTYVGVTNTDLERTLTLPSTADFGEKLLYINDESGLAGTNNIIINTFKEINYSSLGNGTSLEFDTTNSLYNSLIKIDDTHYLNTYQGADYDGFAIVLNVSGTTITANTAFEFDTVYNEYNSLIKINDTHYLNAYRGVDSDGFAVVLMVDGTTITKGTALEFFPLNVQELSLSQINSTHYLCTFADDQTEGRAIVFVVDGTTITNGTSFRFDENLGRYNSLAKINDTHYLNTYYGNDGDGFAVVLMVDGTTITKGTALEFDTVKGQWNSLAKINDTHYLNAYSNGVGVAVVLSVDGTTITKGTALEFEPVQAVWNSLVKIDDTHYLNIYNGVGYLGPGYAVVLSVDGTTITKEGTSLEFDSVRGTDNSVVQIDLTHYLNAYTGEAIDGYAIVLTLDENAETIDEASSNTISTNYGEVTLISDGSSSWFTT